MSAPASRTYHSIDILKVVAALLVVAIHARPFVGKTYPLYISLFSRMAVPVFFVVSAFFFFRKKPDTAQLKHYVRDIQLMASGNSAESAMDCHRRVRGVIAEQIFDSHGCKIGKND